MLLATAGLLIPVLRRLDLDLPDAVPDTPAAAESEGGEALRELAGEV